MMENIRIILVRPSHPGNIGAVARAMKNMGLKQLVLVAPEDFPSEAATARASGADDLLQRAQIHPSLEDALSDCHHIVMTTARTRFLNWENFDARTGAQLVRQQAQKHNVAVVFGPERTGLSNQEVELGHQLLHIPVDEQFSSMNLAAAVMLVCYELRLAHLNQEAKVEPEVDCPEDQSEEQAANSAEVEGFILHFQQVMDQVGFLKNKPTQRLMGRVRGLYNRSKMTVQDVNIMRGILAGIQAKIKS